MFNGLDMSIPGVCAECLAQGVRASCFRTRSARGRSLSSAGSGSFFDGPCDGLVEGFADGFVESFADRFDDGKAQLQSADSPKG